MNNGLREIICITDYKGIFGSKFDANPYRSGYSKDYLVEKFHVAGYSLKFISPSEVVFCNNVWKDRLVLYTSSEESGLYYKSFIEDIVFGIREAGGIVMPDAVFLRANNNKVFMEIISQVKLNPRLQTNLGTYYGSLQELIVAINNCLINFPCVIKAASGAKSRGVLLAKDKKELLKNSKRVSDIINYRTYFKELVRRLIHKNYQVESRYQGKFLIQPFVPNLKNDWKILIYGNQYYILRRGVRVNDFRASGSGVDYRSGSESNFPTHMLNFIKEFYLSLNVPHLSLDFGYDGKVGYIFEYQAIHFGTYTQQKSVEFYENIGDEWVLRNESNKLEDVYVASIVDFINRNNL